MPHVQHHLDLARAAEHRLGEVQHDVAVPHRHVQLPRHQPRAALVRVPVRDGDVLRRLGLGPARQTRLLRRRRQILDQLVQLAVGPRGHRRLDPLVELVAVDASVAGGHPQLVHDDVPVFM
ncbi:hypothetical protein [Catenulispora acidiphila]|uniref:hypothetical protein n=1 Tax=Catenulispora acidiphila TaxID=304895 RepID=UPI0021D7B075|nr:hypothetical protein [Catenulispora acidiphila]